MFDRLDFLIINSYLIIQCNENEIQLIRSVTSFEELKSNLKCSNKNELLQHTIDNVQVINFPKAFFKCIENKKIRSIGHFVRIKPSLDRSKNGVQWPFMHTEIKKTSLIKMKFLKKKEIDIDLDEIDVNDLLTKQNDIYIYFDFVNRPMVCNFLWYGIDKNTHDKSCDKIPVKDFQTPTCYYKVNSTVTPSHKELEDIIKRVFPYYVKDPSINYIYIGPNSGSSGNQVLNNGTIGENSIIIPNNKNPTVNAIRGKSNNKTQSNNEKKNSKTILIILIIFICLIVIVISIIFYYKEFLKNNNELTKNDSNTSNESQISVLSNPTELNNDDLIIPPLEQIKNDKQQTMQRTATNWFELEEEI
ncbi:unnamed protein product [Adineta steineri]|uniref:Uncharacterized protein n=1 Tax=Adineta steineri TaxID=433720 RepID=A0A818K980_9BILA|nr:unnamed protein product [Adineta steineri]